jgi:hypothetical protein
VGDDSDPLPDIGFGDRGDGRLGGSAGLGRQRGGRGEDEAGQQDWAHGWLEEECGR